MRFVLLLAIPLCATAQQKPNFSANWALNLDASDYSDPRAAKPEKFTMAIQQKGEHFKYKVDSSARGGRRVFEVEVMAGGNLYESDAAGIVSLEWKGDVLAVNTLFNPGQERQSDQAERWTLSADGKRLTDDLTVHLPHNRGSVHIVRVLDKQ